MTVPEPVIEPTTTAATTTAVVVEDATDNQASPSPAVESASAPEKQQQDKLLTLKQQKEKAMTEYDAIANRQKLQRLNFLLERSTLYANFLTQRLETHRQELIQKGGASSSENGASSSDKQQQQSSSAAEEEQKLPLPKQPAAITGATMRNYQLAGLGWLISLYENGLNGCVADQMGLGKSLQAISLLAFLRERGVWGPFLIVCPLSTLSNWCNEFRKFAPSIPILSYHDTADMRAKMRRKHKLSADMRKATPEARNKYPVVITTYEVVMRDSKYLRSIGWKYVIVDEGHRLKNVNCKLVRELKSYQSANRLLLTGTPLQNNISELWSLLNFLLPDIFDDLDSFQAWFDFDDVNNNSSNNDNNNSNVSDNSGGGAARILNEEQSAGIVSKLHHILKPFLLRRVKADVECDLPKKREYILYAPLTNVQRQFTDALLNKQMYDFLQQRFNASTANMAASSSSAQATATASAEEVEDDTMEVLPDLDEDAPAPVADTEDIPDLVACESTPSTDTSDSATPTVSREASETPTPAPAKLDPAPLSAATADGNKRPSRKRSAKMAEELAADIDSVSSGRYKTRRVSRAVSHLTAPSNSTASTPPPQQQKQQQQQSTASWSSSVTSQLTVSSNSIKSAKQLRLQSLIMQLRKCCNHPYLFDPPLNPHTGYITISPDIVSSSGKLVILDRLLPELFARGHRVLIFSQMTKMLDVLEAYVGGLKGWNYCRIDGTVPAAERQMQIAMFDDNKIDTNDPYRTNQYYDEHQWYTSRQQQQQQKKQQKRQQKSVENTVSKDSIPVFLLSTRSGGVGINLTAADTVIIFDSDWNPQMDLQAQDRVHRIGQTKPVIVYRLVCAGSVESKILERSNAKRRLERLVIQRSSFKHLGSSSSSTANGTQSSIKLSELAEILMSDDNERIGGNATSNGGDEDGSGGNDVKWSISDQDFEKLLDRSEEAYERHSKVVSDAASKAAAEAFSSTNLLQNSTSGGASHVFTEYETANDDVLSSI